ncbi:tRNA lysidine(34) synthetase TilS [Virgibacillus kekensis]|uniref:tRNA(Ile)-lysidine synthase n=1 Tax=Virgibacillus kekensis TaxID=202261 RepID=A0ABV9DKP7_9BACI
MINEVQAFIEKHKLLKKNSTVLLGVSGGPDSMALLHYFKAIRDNWNLTVIALSADHQLRGAESREDLAYVESICSSWDIKFIGTFLDVSTYKQDRQIGTQVAARELRYNFFKEQMIENNADFLALGHHGDDQVETMLMALSRSASPSSLSGIPIRREFANGQIIRPLLAVTKNEIEMYCRSNGIYPRRDPSNEETTYTRNFFRKRVIPLIKEQNSNIKATVQHLSEALQEDERYLRQEAARLVETTVNLKNGNKEASFNILEFQTYPHSLQRRAYHLILNYLYNKLPRNLSYVHEKQFFTLLDSAEGNIQIDFPQQLKLKRVYQTAVFSFSNDQSQRLYFQQKVNIPGETELPDGSVLQAILTDSPEVTGELGYYCNKASIELPLHIRTRQAGDRMRWEGLNGSKKVKDIFIDAKVPLEKRDIWPILTDNKGEILWIIGLKKGKPKQQVNKGTYIQLTFNKGNM